MALIFNEDTGESVKIDLDKWHNKILPLLKATQAFFKYDAQSSTSLEDFSPKITKPCLLGVLHEIANTEDVQSIDPDFYNEVRAVTDYDPEFDEYGILTLNTAQANFINNHEEAVSAWIPLVIKKHIKPHARCIKDFLNGSV